MNVTLMYYDNEVGLQSYSTFTVNARTSNNVSVLYIILPLQACQDFPHSRLVWFRQLGLFHHSHRDYSKWLKWTSCMYRLKWECTSSTYVCMHVYSHLCSEDPESQKPWTLCSRVMGLWLQRSLNLTVVGVLPPPKKTTTTHKQKQTHTQQKTNDNMHNYLIAA